MPNTHRGSSASASSSRTPCTCERRRRRGAARGSGQAAPGGPGAEPCIEWYTQGVPRGTALPRRAWCNSSITNGARAPGSMSALKRRRSFCRRRVLSQPPTTATHVTASGIIRRLIRWANIYASPPRAHFARFCGAVQAPSIMTRTFRPRGQRANCRRSPIAPSTSSGD